VTIDLDLILKIAVPLATLVLGKYLDRWISKRSKLISYLGHASAFTLRDTNPMTIHTHSIVVRNTGRVAADNVRIGHYVLPEHFQLSPSVSHTVENNAGGIAEIVIPKLVPEEQVTISYLYTPPLLWSQIHAYTKSDEGFAKILNVLPTPQFPRWLSRTIWVLVFVGVVSLLYLAVELIKRLVPFA
jgi:hypothetical protein